MEHPVYAVLHRDTRSRAYINTHCRIVYIVVKAHKKIPRVLIMMMHQYVTARYLPPSPPPLLFFIPINIKPHRNTRNIKIAFSFLYIHLLSFPIKTRKWRVIALSLITCIKRNEQRGVLSRESIIFSMVFTASLNQKAIISRAMLGRNLA